MDPRLLRVFGARRCRLGARVGLQLQLSRGLEMLRGLDTCTVHKHIPTELHICIVVPKSLDFSCGPIFLTLVHPWEVHRVISKQCPVPSPPMPDGMFLWRRFLAENLIELLVSAVIEAHPLRLLKVEDPRHGLKPRKDNNPREGVARIKERRSHLAVAMHLH